MIEFSSLVDLLGSRADRDFGFTFLADAPDSGVAEASRLSFRELDERARAIGAGLVQRGLTGERALLVYPPGLDYVAAFFGCLYAGVVAVPVFPPDIFRLTRTLPRLAAVATDSQAKVILTDTLILPLSSTLSDQAGLEILAESDWIATDGIPSALAGEWRRPDIRPEAMAFIQYTSGSTSTPKGVMLSHANLLENSALIKETFGHTPESRGMSWLPIYHDMGLIGGVLQPLYSDFPITLMSPLSFLARPMSWLQAVARDEVTTSGGPNFAYDLCVRKFDEQATEGLDLSTWRVAFNGAEPVRASTLDRFAETFAPYGFRKSAFLPCYGLAEATLIVTGKKASEAVREESFSAAGLGRGVAEPSVSPGDTMPLVGSGAACTGARVAVVDTATGHELPDRRVGEIRISGPSLGAGYWGQPDKSAETFVRSPRGGRWLRTGDLGFLDKGELFITGRLKDLIIVRGRNIYPHDIEQAATDAVEELRPGCVVAFGTQRADGEELVVVAEVRREADLSAAKAIADRVRRAVTESQNVGVHEVVLVAPGTIPKTSSGKLQRSSCRQAYLDDTLEPLGHSRAEHDSVATLRGAATDPPERRIGELPPPSDTGDTVGQELSDMTRKSCTLDPGDPGAERAETGPTPGESEDDPIDQVSETIRQIYADLLDIPDIGPDDDFFGDSLLATQLAARVRAALGVELSIRMVFTASTARQLAAHVTSEQQASGSLSASGPRPMPAGGPAPLSYPQKRLWFVDQLSPDTAAYNIPVALRLQGPLDVAALTGSFDGVLRRHQALRTYFPVTETGPVQSVSDAAPPRLGVVDATETPEDEFRKELVEAARRPFDLEEGPLVRLALYRRAADDHVLLLVMHHIVADGWSLGVMTEEVTAGYEALISGLPDPGVPPQVQYPDYARWLSEHDDGAQREHLEYWTRHLDGSVPLNLPTRQPRPALQSFAGAHHHWQLDAPTTHALKQVCRGTDGTLFMVLLAAYGLLLGRHSYASDVVVGTPISGRTHLETEGVIGFFANTLALRLDMSGDPTFTDLVLRVREVCLDGYAHQAVPFERLIETLQPARDLGRNPLFQSAFVLQNTPRPTPQLTGLAVERLELDTATSKFDISLELEESDDGLVGIFEYCTDLFDQETASRFVSDFTRLLRSIAAGPHRPLSELTAASVPPVAIAPQPAPAIGLKELIYRQSYSTPKALAVSYGPQALTYEQLVARAERLADELRERGLGEGSRIGLHQGRGADWVVGLLAVLISGAACVLMDPSRPEEWNERVIREGHPHLVLHRENKSAAGSTAIASEGRRPDEDTACVCFGDDALACVDISTAGLAAHVIAIRQEMASAAGDRVLANSALWKEAAIWECLAALTCGAAFIVPAADEESSTVLERHAPTVMLATPEQADVLGEAGGRGPRVVLIGESLPAHPTHAMRVLLTSMTAPALSWEFDAADGHWYGHPLAAAQTEIRDRFGQPVEQGVCGQLHATGTARTTGLTAEPTKTPTAHVADAGSGRQPMWHPTGVLARYGADGRVEWLGSVQGAGRKEKTSLPAVAPRTPAEEVVEAVWCEVLGRSLPSVHDDFFDLGGHSVAAAQIINRIHSIFRVKVSIQAFFQDPSIAGFTSALTSLEASPGQTEQIAVIWKQVTETASDETAFPTSATDR